MRRTHRYLIGVSGLVIAFASSVGVLDIRSAEAAGCTVTLTSSSSYTGSDAPDTVCIAGTGEYTVDTAGGDDRVLVTGAAASVDATLGDGNDAYVGALASVSTVDGGVGDDRITTGAGPDAVDSGEGSDKVVTGGGDDSVNAGAGDDRVITADGNDQVTAGDGADAVNGGIGSDTLDGEAGNDNVNGSAGDDVVSGGDGSDKVAGTDGNDTLDGGTGDDKISGGNGVDAVSGGTGSDKMSGGNSDDGFDGDSADTIASGDGDAACSDATTLAISCVNGAVVTEVSGTAQHIGSGYTVTVRAHVVDFGGVGATKIAIAERWFNRPDSNSTTTGDPQTGLYAAATPTLVGGSHENGDYEATFALPAAPLSGRMGVRVFTTGFSVDSWASCWLAQCIPMSSATCTGNQCVPSAPATWNCVSNFAYQDAECGQYSAVVVGVTGFPKAMHPIYFDSQAPSAPTLHSVASTFIDVEASDGLFISSAGATWVPGNTTGLDTTFVGGHSWAGIGQAVMVGGITRFAQPYLPPVCPDDPLGYMMRLPIGATRYRLRAYAVTTESSSGEANGYFIWSPDRSTTTARCPY